VAESCTCDDGYGHNSTCGACGGSGTVGVTQLAVLKARVKELELENIELRSKAKPPRDLGKVGL